MDELNQENQEEVVEQIDGFEDITDPKVLDIIKKEKGLNGEEEQENEEQVEDKPKLYAGTYKTIEALRKGVSDIGSTLPQYIIDGMSDSALEQHYKELRTNMSKNGRKFGEQKKEEPKEEKKEEQNNFSIKDGMNELKTFFKENGYISDEIYDKLEKAGLDADFIDEYAEKLDYEQKEFSRKIIEMSGGQEQFFAIKEWAESNIPQDELDAIGRLPYNTMMIALEGIKTRYEKANQQKQKQPERIIGATKTSSSSGGYSNVDEYMRDVRNPKYGKDKYFTENVESRFSKSKFK